MSPVNTTKATIVVNLKSGYNQGKTTVSGKLDINSLLQNKCDQVLREYERDESYLARQKLKKLLKQYPKSTVVKQLYIYILYKDRRYTEAYVNIKNLLKVTPDHPGLLNIKA